MTRPVAPLPHAATLRTLVGVFGLGLAVLLLGGGPAQSAPLPKAVVGVLGGAEDGRRLEALADGVRVAATAAQQMAAQRAGEVEVEVVVASDEGTPAGLQKALRTLRKHKPIGIVAAPSGELVEAYWKASRSTRVPWFFATSVTPDLVENRRGQVWHLAPSPAAQAIEAADAALAPLAARRVGVVHEPTPLGRALAAAFARNLSRHVVLAGMEEWPASPAADAADGLKTFEADWIYAAVTGRHAVSFVRSRERATDPAPCLFADGNRAASLLEIAPASLEGSVFLDGPDPELQGRIGEAVVTALEEAGRPVDVGAVRGFEAARRLLAAWETSGRGKATKVQKVLAAQDEDYGALGRLDYEPHRSVRFFGFTLWQVQKARFDLWPAGLLLTPDCGPPLGFGWPPPAAINEKKGRIGYVTYGDAERRTIEQDLLELGLSTNGAEPALDQAIRDEILNRAIRIAHRLFRREPDGTPIPGWSWGMTFTTAQPSDDLPRSRVWLAFVAGDHPAAGGQVIGSGMVAIYSTFLKREMYIQRKLDPPLSAADRPLFDGTYRWGEDRTLNFRAEKIRCLVDGFSSAVGLTMAHEFGHCCGCGHDTEHPTSIMNVVAGAGAEWKDAVWIPRHQDSVTTTLGVESR